MKNKVRFVLAAAFMTALSVCSSTTVTNAKEIFASIPVNDSLRVDTVLGSMKALVTHLQKEVLPKLTGPAKVSSTLYTDSLKRNIKKADLDLKNKKQTFDKLGDSGKKLFRSMENQVSHIMKNISEKSELYQAVAKGYVAIYKATQEMQANSKKPFLATYGAPYDPNTSRNHQVTIIGAYLNFDLEYRINVGGIEMGPDIVDPERVVFTFPEKLLANMESPQFIEVKASPKMLTGTGKTAKVENYKEQTILLLVYPVKK